jgi:hypothetical protein
MANVLFIPVFLAWTCAAAGQGLRVPQFGVGERAQYRVSYNIIGRVGTSTMEVVSLDTIRNQPAYHIVFRLRGGIPGARIDDRIDSWLDSSGTFTHRYSERKRELAFSRDRTREFFPQERRWTGRTQDRDEAGSLPTDQPLDDIGFLYFVRTLDLEVGREYVLDRYWNQDGNPVRLKVLRRERVRVPAGTYNTIVVQPIIRTSGLFSEGGKAEVYFSDGPRRELVMMRVGLSIGTLRLQLEKLETGRD